MWQVPQQFECMLHTIQAALGGQAIQRTLTIGTWSGWTDLVLVSLLRRVPRHSKVSARHHTHATFDIAPWHVSPCIRSLFDREGVTRVKHGWYGGNESWTPLGLGHEFDGRWPARWPAPVLDFCLVDGAHTFAHIVRDFKTLRTACRVFAFHDIVNSRGWDVPRFWRNITNIASPLHAPEFAVHECTYQPPLSDGQLMGIGLLIRNDL